MKKKTSLTTRQKIVSMQSGRIQRATGTIQHRLPAKSKKPHLQPFEQSTVWNLLSLAFKSMVLSRSIRSASRIKTAQVTNYALYGSTFYRPEGFFRNIQHGSTLSSRIRNHPKIVLLCSKPNSGSNPRFICSKGKSQEAKFTAAYYMGFNCSSFFTDQPMTRSLSKRPRHKRVLQAPSYDGPYNHVNEIQNEIMVPIDELKITLSPKEEAALKINEILTHAVELAQQVYTKDDSIPTRAKKPLINESQKISPTTQPINDQPVLSEKAKIAYQSLDQLCTEPFQIETPETEKKAIAEGRPDAQIIAGLDPTDVSIPVAKPAGQNTNTYKY